MNAQEAIEKIKALFEFKETKKPAPKKEEEVVPKSTPEDVVPEGPVSTSDVPETVINEDGSLSVKEISEKLSAMEQDYAEKFSALIEENKKKDEGLAELVKLVEFLSEQPTEKPTEEKKDGIKNFRAEQKAEKFASIKEGFKQVNEKLKTQ